MRTVFEDTDVTANLVDAKANERGKYVPLILWITAILMLIGSWRAYQWAYNRKPPPPPPPLASLEDPKQIGQIAQKFNSLAQEGKWVEAQQLLSTEAQQKLTAENTTLQASLLGAQQNEKVALASTVPTNNAGDAPDKVRQDCLYRMQDAKGEIKDLIVPLVIVMEGAPPNARLAIGSWKEEKSKPAAAPPATVAASPAAKK